MSLKELAKPTVFKILTFLFIAIFYLYFAKDDVCGFGLFFRFCYVAYGFPFSYIITGDIEAASGHIKFLFLGENFGKYGNFLFNPLTFLLDIVLIYLLSCVISMLFGNIKARH